MGKLSSVFEGNKLKVGLDLNEDGEKSVELELSVNEALQEAMRTGKEVEGVKMVSMKFVGSKMVIVLDTDKDGEPVAKLSVDLMESIDEVKDLVLKK